MSLIADIYIVKRTTFDSSYDNVLNKLEDYQNGFIENPNELVPYLETFKDNIDDLIDFIHDNFDPYWQAINALIQLKNSVIELVWLARTGGIPRGEIRLSTPVSLWALCIDLYGDTSKVDDIKKHNHILDSLRIPTGTVLSVPLLQK